MTSVCFENETIPLAEDETVLEALIRQGHTIPNGCRAGVCQACVMVMDSPDVKPEWQTGLSGAQRELGCFLSCQCKPTEPVTVRRSSLGLTRVPGTLVQRSWLNDNVVRVRIKAPLAYRPGQYVTLWKDEWLARCYSLASHPVQDDFLEFHVKMIVGGAFSPWLCQEAQIGDAIDIQSPLGECFYTPDNLDQPLLLVGIGTGLAPLFGVIRDALSQGHTGSITLVVAASDSGNIYLVDELQAMAASVPQLSVFFIARNVNHDFAQLGDVYQFCAERFANLDGYRVFLCGAETFVRKMRRQCFMAGAGMKAISADAFLPFAQ